MVQDLDEIHAQQPGQGFQFPGVFEITAIGTAEANLELRMPEVLSDIGLHVNDGSAKVRPSSAGNYLSGVDSILMRLGVMIQLCIQNTLNSRICLSG